jgi:hypothetical protein
MTARFLELVSRKVVAVEANLWNADICVFLEVQLCLACIDAVVCTGLDLRLNAVSSIPKPVYHETHAVVVRLVSCQIRLEPCRLLEVSSRLLVAILDSVLLSGFCFVWAYSDHPFD